MRPLKMEPVFKERLWGGRRLAEVLGKPLPTGRAIGESWELADHPHGQSRVAEGPLAGRTLREVLQQDAEAVLGEEGPAPGTPRPFPLMVKFLDAADRLSVQVHPSSGGAGAEGREGGKTECWVVLHADPGAWVVEGLASGTTLAGVGAAVDEGRLPDLLHVRPVSAGDFVWVPAGLVHAAGPGLLLAEVQQTSNLTYRLFDWDRVGPDGVARPLHVREALEAVRLEGQLPPSGGRGTVCRESGLLLESLVASPAFTLARVGLEGRGWTASTERAWAVVVALAGTGRLVTDDAETPLKAGETVLMPARAGWYRLEASEALSVLVAAPPGRGPALSGGWGPPPDASKGVS